MQPISHSGFLRLAVPAALSALLNNSFRLIDQYAVQWLGVDAQAAIASCGFVSLTLFSIYGLISAGAGPLVARATGANDPDLRGRLLGSAFIAAGMLGAVALVTTFCLAPFIARTLGLSASVANQSIEYLRALAVFGAALSIAPLIDIVLLAMGRSGAVLRLQLVANALNFLLNPLLIYHYQLGITGAAMATGFAYATSAVCGVMWLRRIGWSGAVRMEPAVARRIVGIGAPICLSSLCYVGVYWALLRYAISPLGPVVNAGLGIGYAALEGVTWPLFWGLSVAVASLVGRYLGAGHPDYAWQAIRRAFPWVTLTGLVASLAFWFGAQRLSSIFTDDPSVLAQAACYARILAFSQLFVAYEALAEGVLAGAGATRAVFWWSVPINLLRVPAGWYLAIPLGWSAAGIWWVINFTTYMKAFGKWAAVFFGRWHKVDL